jgi:hypothetical protein
MTLVCPICDRDFEDGDDVVAIMASKFKYIPSEVNYAIEQPTKCIEIVHDECFNWEEYEPEGVEA